MTSNKAEKKEALVKRTLTLPSIDRGETLLEGPTKAEKAKVKLADGTDTESEEEDEETDSENNGEEGDEERLDRQK